MTARRSFHSNTSRRLLQPAEEKVQGENTVRAELAAGEKMRTVFEPSRDSMRCGTTWLIIMRI